MWVIGAPGAATTNSSGVEESVARGPQTPSAPVVFVSSAAPCRSPVSAETL